MSKALFVLAVLVALPLGEQGSEGLFTAVAVVEQLPADYEAVNQVLLLRGTDLSDPERRGVARAIAEEAETSGFDPFLILGVIDVESDFRRDVVSSADARGLMQIQPVTLGWLAMREQWSMPSEEIGKDPALCVRLGVRYLKYLRDRFQSLNAALMAYNMGPNKFALLAQEKGALDPYWSYPSAVRRDAAHLKLLHGKIEAPAAMAVGDNSAKPPPPADGIRGG